MNKHTVFSSLFYRFFTKMADLVILNFLFLLGCIPIITMGTSCAALYAVALKMCRGTETYILKDFLAAYRQNLKQGIILHLIFSICFIIIAIDFYVMWNILEFSFFLKWMFALLIIFSILIFIASMYIYPLLAQFNNTIKGHMRSAIVLSVKHFPYTIMFVLVTALPIVAFLMLKHALEWGILLFLFIGFAGITYLFSHFFVIIFREYIDTPNET